MSVSDGKSVVTLDSKESKGEIKKKFKIGNPVRAAQAVLARRKVREEKRLLRREELMKQDAERFLMELEEKHSWIAYELRERNFSRMVKEQHVRVLTAKEEKIEKERLLEVEKEQGLSYFRGQISSYRRWQNSPAKHLDISGHAASVSSVKLTPCLGYIVSCSNDKTIMVWALRSGKCMLTLIGHSKKVNDVDVHPNFSMSGYNVSIVSCSSDCTLRYWNCVVNEPIKIVQGHAEAVYKCSFAPGGQRVVSCSEDQTARIWTVPEGYLLFIYQVHSSPVSTVRFSPSGRYIITGSDYGERRLILWDATYPKFEVPTQLPHMIYWTPEGLIRKILFQKKTPSQHFWLTQKQLGDLDDSELVETWVGENATLDDVASESDENEDGDNDEDMGEEDIFGKDDIRDAAGAAVSVTALDKNGEQVAADEYIAGGGTLVISLQSIVNPIAEAFVSVNLKEPQYEAFSNQSGARVGNFRAAAPIPWRPFITDPLNIRPPHRIPPKTVKESCGGKAFQYKEKREFNRITGEEVLPSIAVEMLWTSPPPNMGPVVVTVNLRLRNEKSWRKLTYSLRESPIRLNSGDDDTAEGGDRFLFDQEERHDMFWRFVREQNWSAVEAFFEKRCAIFFEKKMFVRRRRILLLLKRIFGVAEKPKPKIAGVFSLPDPPNMHLLPKEKHIVVAWPFIHTSGQTRSTVMMEDMDIFPDNRTLFSFQSYHDPEPKTEDDDQPQRVLSRSGDDDDDVEGDYSDAAGGEHEQMERQLHRDEEENSKMLVLAVAGSKDGADYLAQPPVGDVSADSQDQAPRAGNFSTDVDAHRSGDASGETATGASSARQVSDVSLERLDSIKGAGVEEAKNGSDEEKSNGSNSSSGESDSSSSGSGNYSSSSGDSDSDSDSSSGSDDSDEESASGDRPTKPALDSIVEEEEVKTVKPSVSDKKVVKNTHAKNYTRLPSSSSPTSKKHKTRKVESKHLVLPPVKKKSFFRRWFGGKSNPPSNVKFSTDIFDTDTFGKTGGRKRGQRLKMPKIIYTEPIEGKEFQKKVKYLATKESDMVSRLQLLGVSAAEESRTYTTRGYTVEDMKNVGDTPGWLLQHDKLDHSDSLSATKVMEEDDIDVPNAQDGRFGPRAVGLNMPLPSAFPSMAGRAKEALKANLKKDEKAKKKIEKMRIPGPAEAVRMREEAENRKFFETPVWLKKRRRQKELANMMELDVGMSIMLSSGYPAGRRESLGTLPGMSKHYPNSHYVNKARLPPGYVEPKQQQNLFQSLFKRKKKKNSKNGADIIIAPPVGRKPLESCSQFRNIMVESKEGDEDSAVGAVAADSVFPFLPEDGAESIVTDGMAPAGEITEPSSASVADGSIVYAMEGSLASRRGSVQPDDATADTKDSKQDPATGASLQGSVATRRASTRQSERIEAISGGENHGELTEAIFVGRQSRVPREVFLERRGSFTVAPGLENFSKYLEEKKDSTKSMKYDSFGRVVKMAPEAMPRKEIKAAGLIRVMHTNGFDIAHQGTIYDATFSPSENRIASCGGDHLIKLWDPRDGSFVRRLVGHTNEVTALCYTKDELYLVSAGADQTILVWDMSVFQVTRTLRGHADVINGLSISFDCSFVVSCSFDSLIKTWFMTPRSPDAPQPPKIVTKTENSVMISWQAPPSFNEPITAFKLQYQVPGQDDWGPRPAISIPPQYRQKTVFGLSPCTTYQFRLQASNRMGDGEWGAVSRLVKTNMGNPLRLERPDICDITGYSISLYFFTPNPKLFGAASSKFLISWSGEGKPFDDENVCEVSLEDGVNRGEALIVNFAYWASEEGQKKKIRAKKNGKIYKNMSAIDVPLQTMEQTLSRNASVDSLLMSVEIPGLLPGCLYRFRVAGINSFGQGEWSELSYSQGTLPGVPETPKPPYKIASDLTWITMKWDPPNDSGSAIVGYRVWIKHINYYTDLPRAQVTYQMTRLLPGQHYYIKVLAKNAVGWSEYSEYNSDDQAETSTAAPDVPGNPRAVAAGWGYMVLEGRFSYENGRDITHMYVQYREVQAFSKGQWSREIEYDVKKDINLIEESVPTPAAEDDENNGGVNDESKANKPRSLPKRKRIVRMATGVLEEVKTEINTEIDKPIGRRFTFEVNPLLANTLYEFRLCFQNDTGRSDYGIPSQRAKTRNPEVPEKCKAPRCLDVMPTFILIGFSAPATGGCDITNFTLKLEDTVTDTTTNIRIMPHANEYKMEGLKPGYSYRMCLRADNLVGEGEFSNWTKVVKLPKDKTEIAEKKLQAF